MTIVVAVDVVESADTENPGANENQGLLDYLEAERNTFPSIWIVLPEC